MVTINKQFKRNGVHRTEIPDTTVNGLLPLDTNTITRTVE